jgi:hypothetical protein
MTLGLISDRKFNTTISNSEICLYRNRFKGSIILQELEIVLEIIFEEQTERICLLGFKEPTK